MTPPSTLLDRRVRPVTFAMVTIVAIFAFEGLAIVAALPSVAVDLGGVELLPWTVTGYLVAASVATAVFGGVVDARGVAPVFRISVAAFAGFSLLAGLAWSMEILVLARVLQGVAAGAMAAVAGTLVVVGFPEHLVGRAAAANSNVWGVFGFAAPALAAGLLVFAGWRWIFFSMAPLCLVTLGFGWRALPVRTDRRDVGFDWPGIALLSLAVGSLLVAVSSPSRLSPLWALAAVVLGVVWWRRTGTSSQTLVARRYIGSTPYLLLNVAAALTIAAMLGAQTYLPVYVRGVAGGSESLAAWAVIFLTVGWTVAANVAGRITQRASSTSVLLFGVTTAPIWVLSTVVAVRQGWPLWVVFGLYALMGTAVGTTTNVTWQILKDFVGDGESGRATAAHQFIRSLGQSLGAGAAGGVILLVAAFRLDDLEAITQALGGEVDGALGGSASAALAAGFFWALIVLLGLQFIATVQVWRRREALAPPPPGQARPRVTVEGSAPMAGSVD